MKNMFHSQCLISSGPRVNYVIDKHEGVVKVNYEVGDASEPQLCMKRGKEGRCRVSKNITAVNII